MSEVALPIGGRTYRVACAAGEEERVRRLGATISSKIESLGNSGGPDSMNLLFAALLLADEVQEGRDSAAAGEGANGFSASQADDRQELEAKIDSLEAELARLQDAVGSASDELAQARASEHDLNQVIAGHEKEIASLRSQIEGFEQETQALPETFRPIEGTADLAALAPALEHFAELLEQCADKLESRARVS